MADVENAKNVFGNEEIVARVGQKLKINYKIIIISIQDTLYHNRTNIDLYNVSFTAAFSLFSSFQYN